MGIAVVAYSDFELAQMHVDALFIHDANEKLVQINEPSPNDPAPRFFLTRTAAGNLWRTRFDLPDDLVVKLEWLATDEPVARDLHAPLKYAAAYARLLMQHADLQQMVVGPTFTLPELDAPERTIRIIPENAALLGRHFGWLQGDLDGYAPIVVVVADDAAVALCYSSRLTTVAGEAGVETEPAYRGRGFAPDAVRGWAAGLRAMGRLPLYNTSWTNHASQAVARKLGGVQFAVDFSIT